MLLLSTVPNIANKNNASHLLKVQIQHTAAVQQDVLKHVCSVFVFAGFWWDEKTVESIDVPPC
jgi:hypothetical protein